MKYLLFVLLILCLNFFFAQKAVEDYDDGKLNKVEVFLNRVI